MTMAMATTNGNHIWAETRSRAFIIRLGCPASIEVEDVLRAAGFTVESETYGYDTAPRIAAMRPEVVLLLIPSPDARSLFACGEICRSFDTALVICSPSGRESDVIRGLEAGADDYLILPMGPRELIARLRALLRRLTPSSLDATRGSLIVGDLEVRLDERKALYQGQPIQLSPTQFRLLVALVREAGRVVTHAQLLTQTWGPEYVDSRNYVRLYIKYLRSKIEDDPSHPRFILSERGVGYRFETNGAHPLAGSREEDRDESTQVSAPRCGPRWS